MRPEQESIITEQQLPQSSLLTNPQQVKKKSFFRRAFAPIKKGAMRGSIFALLASAMGTGMFNLPFRIFQIGVVPYIFFILCGGLFSYLGMYLISRLILQQKFESYSVMADRAYGSKFKRIAQFCLVIYPWGITICFQVIFAKFFVQLLNDNCGLVLYEQGGRKDEIYNTLGNWIRIGVNLGSIAVNMIFVLKKEIGILQKVSLVGVVAVMINVAIIAITFIIGFKDGDVIYNGLTGGVSWDLVNWFEMSNWEDVSLQVQGLASIIFCYVNHQLVFPLAADLYNPTKRRLDKIFNRIHFVEALFYTLVGMSGYLLLVQHGHIAPMVMTSIKTAAMSIGKLLMLVALFFAVPLNLYPAKETIYEIFSLQRSKINHIALSFGLALSGCLVAILFQQVNSYFGLLGGTAGVMMAGGIPSICYAKIIGLKRKLDWAIIVFMGIISVLGMVGAIMSVVDAATDTQ